MCLAPEQFNVLSTSSIPMQTEIRTDPGVLMREEIQMKLCAIYVELTTPQICVNCSGN